MEDSFLPLFIRNWRQQKYVPYVLSQYAASTHVLAKIGALNRVLCVAQTMVYVLNVLSEVAPEWVRAFVPEEWVDRYGERLEHERLPQEEGERKEYANQVGMDGWTLLQALDASSTADWLKTLPAVDTLRTIWSQQFEPREQGGGWRGEPALPAGQLINSPYDLDARYGKKRNTLWVGYKVHFSETCEEDAPQLITHVETTRAGVNDERALVTIHAGLAGKDLLPQQHLVDAGYVDASNLLGSQQLGVDLLGPVRHNYWWQADTDFDVTHFAIDWQAQTVTCPHGKISSSWTPAQDGKGHPVVKIKFSQLACKVCCDRASCTGQTRRTLTLQPQERMQALLAARQREKTEAFKQSYRRRAGIEGTHSRGIRTMGLRRSRYYGLAKTHLGHIAIATAINVAQLMSWLRGDVPAQTRTSRFRRLMQSVDG